MLEEESGKGIDVRGRSNSTQSRLLKEALGVILRFA